MTFAEKMRKLRKDKGKSQEEASREMKIAISTLRNYENGRLPDTYQLKIIKNYYKVPYEYLLEDDCNNLTNETLNIGQKLKLSDDVIKKIDEINEYEYSNELNYYLNDVGLYRTVETLRYLKDLHFIKIEYIDFFMTLFYMNEYIFENRKNKEKINKLLLLYENKIENISNEREINEFEDFEFPIKNDINVVKKALGTLIKKIKSGEVELKDYMEYVERVIEISRKFETYICFYKYSISERVNRITDKLAPDLYDVSVLYYKELDKYYEELLEIKCDYGFGKDIIEKARKKLKKSGGNYIDISRLKYNTEGI